MDQGLGAERSQVTGRGARPLALMLVVTLVATLFGLVGTTRPAGAEPVPEDQLLVSQVGRVDKYAGAVSLVPVTDGGVVGTPIALPTTTSGADRALTLTGNRPTEGQLQRSPDGQHVTLVGYNAGVGVEEPYDEKASKYARTIGRIDADGTVDTSTALTNAFSETSPRGVVTVDGTGYWLTGSGSEDSPKAGVRYADNGATTSVGLVTTPSSTGLPTVVDGQLLAPATSSGYVGLNAIGTGLPTTAGQTASLQVALASLPSTTYGFVTLTRDAGSPAGFDTVYVAAGTSGILKYSYDGATWAARGSIPGSFFALTGRVDGDAAKLYAVSGSGGGNSVVTFHDTAASTATAAGTTPITLATAPSTAAYRGVSFRAGDATDPGTSEPPTITADTPVLSGAVSDPANPVGAVTVGHPERPVGQVTVSVTDSSDPSVVPVANATVTGDGATRFLTVAPVGVGHTDLTVTARAPGGLTTSTVVRYSASLPAAAPARSTFPGTVDDLSAIVAAGPGHVVATSAADNTVRVFATTASGAPRATVDLSGDLGVTGPADLDGGVRVGDRAYWVGSLANDADGHPAPDHDRLVATDVVGSGADTTVSYAGHSSGLRADLVAWDTGNGHHLGAHHFGLAAAAAAGTPGTDGAGLRAEGLVLAAGGDGAAWLALGAPLVASEGNRSLLVPITNLDALATGAAAHATFGIPVRLDLGGLAIRDIVANDAGQYVILAGPADGTGAPSLFTWDGNPRTTPVRSTTVVSTGDPGRYEAIAPIPSPFKNRSQVVLAADLSAAAIYGDGILGADLPTALRKARLDPFSVVLPANGSTQELPDELAVVQIRTVRSWDDYPAAVDIALLGTDGTPSGSIPLPTAADGANVPFVVTDKKEDEAFLSRSPDGEYLSLLGYNSTTSGSRKPRENAGKVVARVGADGSVDTSTAFPYNALFGEERARSAVTDDGERFWVTADSSGVRYVERGTSVSTAVSSSPKGYQLNIADDQLWVSSGSAVSTVGTGLPTTAGSTVTQRFSGNSASFVLLQVDPSSDGVDTAYGVNGGSITKWVRTGTTWASRGSSASNSYLYVTGRVGEDGQVELYAVSGLGSYSSGNRVVALKDTAEPGATFAATTPTTLATAPATTAYRGIAFAPGNVTPSPAVVVPDAPTAPGAVAGNGSAVVTWDAPAVDGGSVVTNYVVTPWVDGVAGTPVITAGDATSTTVPGLTNGTTYTFTVAAENAIGVGPDSEPTLPVTPAGVETAPGAPRNVGAIAGDASATVTWTAPASNGGSPVTHYVVTPSADGEALAPITTAGPVTELTVTGLANGTAHTFTVAAVNVVGTGPASAPSAPVTPSAPDTVPDAPTEVAAVAGDGSATVSWTAPASDGGSPVTHYVVTPRAGDTDLDPVVTDDASTSVVVPGLANGTSHSFTVAAVNAVGTSAESLPSSPVTPSLPTTPPGAPTAVMAVARDGEATVSWTAPAEDGNSPVTHYVVTPHDGATALSPVTTPDATTSSVVTGLTNGTPYTFTVVAVNAVGPSASSEPSAPVTPQPAEEPATVPGSPTEVTGVPGDGQVTVTWTAPDDDGGTAILGYEVTPRRGGEDGPTLVTSTAATSAVVPDLVNGADYTFTVRARNGVGLGPASSASAPVTPRTTPGAPTGVAGTAGDGQVALTWTAPASNGGAPITGYVVTPSRAGVPQAPITLTGAATSTTVTGLTNGSGYTFTVAATNAAGTGAASAPSAAVTPTAPVTVPGAPTGVAGTAGDGQVALTWTAPASNGGSPVTGYVVTPSRAGVPEAPIVLTGAGTATIVTGLANGSSYTFTVSATNTAGTGPASTPSATLVPRTTPGAPAITSATPGNGQVALVWTAPTDTGGAAITGYTVTPSRDGVAQGPISLTGTATSTTVSGLTNGATYTFTVAARNAAGTGTASEPSAPVTPRTTPGVPTAVTAVAGNGEAVVSWTAPTSTGGVPLVGYTVTPYRSGVAQAPVVLTGDATSTTVTGLVNGSSYTFTVIARNAAGSGSASAQSSAVVPRTVPDAPTGVTAVVDGTTIKLTWTAPTANGGSAVTGYVVTPTRGGVELDPVVLTGTGTSYVLEAPVGGASYTFTVAATNVVGTGAASSPTAPVTLVTPPAAPTGVTVTPGDAKVSISWTAPTENGGSTILSYVVVVYIDGILYGEVKPITGTSTQVSGLVNGASYSFGVRAVNVKGPGAESERSRTVSPAAPTVPTPGRTPTEAFVVAASTDFIGRAPTVAERSRAVTALDNRSLTKAAHLRQLATSDPWLAAVVQKLYRDTLGREGEAAGVAFWSDQIRRGRSVASVAAAFYASPEYYTGIGGGELDTWVTDLYTKVLRRPVDAAGRDYWVSQARSRGRGVVALRFYQSPESARRRVADLYQALLGRAAEPGGLDYWAPRVVAVGDIELAKSLAASGEYQRRAEERFP